MKALLSAVFISGIFILNGQTLTQQANEPKPGDKEFNYFLDTTAFTGSLPANTGSNVTWDFTKLKAVNPRNQVDYMVPDSVQNSGDFPGCTFVQTGAYNSFYKSSVTPTTQTELLGLNSTTLNLNLTNPATVAKYPMSFGTSITDNLSGTFNAFNISGNCIGKIVTNIDGSGTLNLPENISLTNVLRLKSVQTMTLTSGLIPVATLKQTLINFYHPPEKFAVLSISYAMISPITGTPIAYSIITGNGDFFVTGLGENHKSDIIQTYPNPTNGVFTIHTPGVRVEDVEVYDNLGEQVLKQAYAGSIDLTAKPAGLYHVVMRTEKGILRARVIRN